MLTLPEHLDPCDFLLQNGAGPFRAMVDRAVDPLTFAIDRASDLFDLDSAEGSRQASERVLSVLAGVPSRSGSGLDVKVAKAVDSLSQRLRVPVSTLNRRLRELSARPKRPTIVAEGPELPRPIAVSSLDPIDLELIRILLNDPSIVGRLITRVTVASLRDEPLRAILQACYDLHVEGQVPGPDLVVSRLDDGAIRGVAEALLSPRERAPISPGFDAPMEIQLSKSLTAFSERERLARIRDLRAALKETDPESSPDELRAMKSELNRLYLQRPDTKRLTAS